MVYAKTSGEALKECPWASVMWAVDGGFVCFEDPDQLPVWLKAGKPEVVRR